MRKITKAILVKRFHKNSKQRRKEKQHEHMKYYSEFFLCWDCEQMCHRDDEYPCDGSNPGKNQCIDCLHSKRYQTRKRDYYSMVHHKYSVIGITVEEAQSRAKREFELNEWYGGEIFDDNHIPYKIKFRY